MNKTYCGACHGERGCPECNKAAKTAVYTGLTEFLAAEDAGTQRPETGCGIEAGNMESGVLYLAADLGTTTLAFVCEDADARVSYGTENPQRTIAADVIGRVDAAIRGKRELLQTMIREALAKGFLFVLERLCEEKRCKPEGLCPEKIRIAVAGNTVMEHLLLGYPADGFAKAPFSAFTTEKTEVPCEELFSDCASYEEFPVWLKRETVTVFPCFSPFVGGDVAAGAYALFPWAVQTEIERDRKGPATERQNNIGKNLPCLLLDLGTNGELLLWNGRALYGTAAAMGSAFEGGRFAYASELFRLVARALRQGAADETGLFCEPYFSEGFEGLLQEDIREFQLAKGALRAGIELLCQKSEVPPKDIRQVYIAGGVGRFCEISDLFETGLLPEEFAGKVSFAGNSCMGGLLRYLKAGKPLLRTEGTYLNLAEQPEYEKLYYRYMNFM